MSHHILRVFAPSDIGCTEDRLHWYFEGAVRGWHQSFAGENDPIRGMSRSIVLVQNAQKTREAERDERHRLIINAYMQAAMDVHKSLQAIPQYLEDNDPDFTEAAHDYAASVLK